MRLPDGGVYKEVDPSVALLPQDDRGRRFPQNGKKYLGGLTALFQPGQGNQQIEHYIKCEDEQYYAYEQGQEEEFQHEDGCH